MALFKTKIVSDMKHNGEIVEVIGLLKGKDIYNDRYIVRFNDGSIDNNIMSVELDFDYKKENNIYGIAMAKLNEQMLYDPKEYIENSLEFIRNHDVSVKVFHPGYLDQYILTHSSFTLIRAMECDFLCSSWLKDWLKEYQIELTDFRKVKNA